MAAKRNTCPIISIVGLILLLGAALGLDALMYYLGRNLGSLGMVVLWSYSLSTLLIAAASLLLFWFVLTKTPGNVGVAIIFLLTGCFFVAYPALYFLTGFLVSMPPGLENLLTNPHSYVVVSGGMIAITGVFKLVMQGRKP